MIRRNGFRMLTNFCSQDRFLAKINIRPKSTTQRQILVRTSSCDHWLYYDVHYYVNLNITMDPPTLSQTRINMPMEHSLPNVEEIRTEAAISSGTSSSKTNRRNLFLVAVCVLALTAIIGISSAISTSGGGSKSSGSSSSSSNSGNSANPSNTKNSRHQDVQNFLTFISEREDLEKAGTPQFFASRWIADEDLRALEIPASTAYNESFKFAQRYILAVFYYATGGEDWKFDTAEFLGPRDECDWSFGLAADAVIPASGSDRWDMGVTCNADSEVSKIFFRKLKQSRGIGKLHFTLQSF
jgi:hypothetical protein